MKRAREKINMTEARKMSAATAGVIETDETRRIAAEEIAEMRGIIAVREKREIVETMNEIALEERAAIVEIEMPRGAHGVRRGRGATIEKAVVIGISGSATMEAATKASETRSELPQQLYSKFNSINHYPFFALRN